jgi:hypothetical protein
VTKQTKVRYVVFSGPVELEGLGHVIRVSDQGVTANGQDKYPAPDMYLDGSSLVIRTHRGVDRFALAGGAVRQYRCVGDETVK